VPHPPQNRNRGGFRVPHARQTMSSGAPQQPQKLVPCGLSKPHREQPSPVSLVGSWSFAEISMCIRG
jgi:hypothetical protein